MRIELGSLGVAQGVVGSVGEQPGRRIAGLPATTPETRPILSDGRVLGGYDARVA
jgi:hypothetical protein